MTINQPDWMAFTLAELSAVNQAERSTG